jgi:putative transposase
MNTTAWCERSCWNEMSPPFPLSFTKMHYRLYRVATGRGTNLQQRSTRPKARSRASRETESSPPAAGTQKKGIRWKRTRHSHRQKQDPQQRAIKQADLEMLEMAAAAGAIDLYYADESGCCQWTPVSYSYYFEGEQKRQEQTRKRGKRLSILGLWQPQVTFAYSLVLGSLKSEDYIAMLNQQAEAAAVVLAETGRIRVIVQDNGSIHTSKVTRQQWSTWEAQGLYLFFLPAYCSEMNPIEVEWGHLKRDELVGQMFESEVEMAYHVVAGLESRGERMGHTTEYVNIRNVKPA